MEFVLYYTALPAYAVYLLFLVWLGFAGVFLRSRYWRFMVIAMIAFPLLILALSPMNGIVANSIGLHRGGLDFAQWILNFIRFIHFSVLSTLAMVSVFGTALLLSITGYGKSS